MTRDCVGGAMGLYNDIGRISENPASEDVSLILQETLDPSTKKAWRLVRYVFFLIPISFLRCQLFFRRFWHFIFFLNKMSAYRIVYMHVCFSVALLHQLVWV
jgi:hypothetical protein